MIELMTIGYESLPADEFYALVRRCKVSMLVDVRELPISRRAGFSKSALAVGLAERRIKYIHLPALGCPREIRHGYRDDANWPRYARRFNEYLETQPGALQELAELMKKERCCLMCFEADYNFCHRSFVAQQVAPVTEMTVRVIHLTGPVEGRVVRHEMVLA